jgi:hypothetical protein
MLRLRAEALIGPTAVKHDIERRLDLHRQKLALYRQLEARDFSADELSREKQVQHLVLTAGIMLETFWVEWSEKALEVLSQPAQK